MKQIAAALIIILLHSCDLHHPVFSITNNTALSIDSLCIEPNAKTTGKYISLKPKQTVKYRSDISHQKSDGTYFMIFKTGNRHRSYPVGYFSNGNALEKMISIEILADSIRVKPVF